MKYLWLASDDPIRRFGITFVELPDPPKRKRKKAKKKNKPNKP